MGWQSAAASLERDGYAIIEDALSAEQVERILQQAKRYAAERRHTNYADALGFCADFAEMVDVPEVLDAVVHWLGPNLYVNHSHVTILPAGQGAPVNAWHRDGGTELSGATGDGCERTLPLFIKVGFVLTDMTEAGMGNLACLPLYREPDWAVTSASRAIVNADMLRLKAGTAVLFERCWHSGLSNAANSEDRCIFYLQYARRFLQPMDPTQYTPLRQLPCSPVRKQLLQLPGDVEYSGNNRSSFYYPRALPLLDRQNQRGIPFKGHSKLVPAGYVSRNVPAELLPQIEALVRAQEGGRASRLALPLSAAIVTVALAAAVALHYSALA